MNVLYCGDCGVTDGIYLSVLSLLKNTSEKLRVFILTANAGARPAIGRGFVEKLETAASAKQKQAEITLIDASAEFSGYLPAANMKTRFTPLCMLRLFADKLPEIPDKILYLDSDVMCLGDFSPLYNLDLSDAEIAGVPDRYGKYFFGNPFKHDYLNSGVLLMNMAAIRKSGLFEKCRRLCRDKKMFMPDQSALNKLAVKRKVPVCYNEQGKIKKKTVFKHFTTFFKFFPYVRAVTVKPWDIEKVHGELKIFEFDDILQELKRSKTNDENN